MSTANHVAILLSSSLDQPRAGKANPGKPDFYIQAAFPASAGADLAAEMNAVSPSGNLNGLKYNVARNDKQEKPFAGIPDDALIVRFGTGPGYPPDLYGEDGSQIQALPVNGGRIQTEFYSGQRVRINGFARYWKHESGSKGVSWSLNGVMVEGGGERRAAPKGEPSESAFAKYRNADGAAQQAPQQAQQADPFQQSGGAPASADPFQQSGGASASADPFQQSGGASASADPFA